MATHTAYTKPETYFFLTILIVVGVLSFLVFMPFMTTLILAAAFAAAVYPLHKRVLKVLKGNRTLASFITLVSLIILVIAPMYLIAAQVFTEALSTYHHVVSDSTTLSSVADTLQEKFNTLVEAFFPGITIDLKKYVLAASAWLLQNTGAFFSGTISIGLRLVLGLFAFYYFIKDGSKFIQLFQDHSPIPREHTDVLITKLRLSIRSIIGGSMMIALLKGVVAGIGLAIFGIPNPALWGTLTGLAALIPGVGTAIVLVPAIVYAFATGTLFQGIGLTIWGVLIVGLLDNFLGPYLIGRGLNIHPIVILFSVIGGLAFFGPEGFLLGPLTIALFIALFSIYRLMVKTEEEALEEEQA
jgi:predicted PurR-regulated permease PerM